MEADNKLIESAALETTPARPFRPIPS